VNSSNASGGGRGTPHEAFEEVTERETRVTGQPPRMRMPVMSQPTLHTGRIRLVPLADEHLEYEVELDSDPERASDSLRSGYVRICGVLVAPGRC
jgi:hypothetical protein